VNEKYIPAQFQSGIAVLDQDSVIGSSVVDLLNLDDAILEFDLTPNRADALSMMGVAYEVAAILDIDVQLPSPKMNMISEHVTDEVNIKVEDEDLCPYYGAYLVKDITIKTSPLWMQNYLLASGIKPINNAVDITNYVLLEYGQP